MTPQQWKWSVCAGILVTVSCVVCITAALTGHLVFAGLLLLLNWTAFIVLVIVKRKLEN